MITVTINGKTVDVEPGTLILDAAEKAGFEIPTLCYLPGQKHISSCMVCCVKDLRNGGLTPACTAKVADGMEIDTESEDVYEMRKNSLELLLTEHIGDCEAPCRLACPAGMDIPTMLRHIQDGNTKTALTVANEHLAMPATLGYVCEAPCEKACRRGRHDKTIAIKEEHRFVAEHEEFKSNLRELATGNTIAIVGAGIAGLTAAHFLMALGHSCTIFEKKSQPGGYVRTRENLPESILDQEINQITGDRDSLRLNTTVDVDALTKLTNEYDAVVLACGENANDELSAQIGSGPKGITVDSLYQTSMDKVFAIGGCIKKGGKIINAAADGRKVVVPVHSFVSESKASAEKIRFNSRMGGLKEGELAEFMKCASPNAQVNLTENSDLAKAVSEAERCMHCDCRKPETCKLRIYSEEYGADQKYFGMGSREPITIEMSHDKVTFEPSKCITCGICIQVCEQAGETFGLSYTGRGYDLSVTIPFDEMITSGMCKETAHECARLCPTAAISLKKCSKSRTSK